MPPGLVLGSGSRKSEKCLVFSIQCLVAGKEVTRSAIVGFGFSHAQGQVVHHHLGNAVRTFVAPIQNGQFLEWSPLLCGFAFLFGTEFGSMLDHQRIRFLRRVEIPAVLSQARCQHDGAAIIRAGLGFSQIKPGESVRRFRPILARAVEPHWITAALRDDERNLAIQPPLQNAGRPACDRCFKKTP